MDVYLSFKSGCDVSVIDGALCNLMLPANSALDFD